MDAQRYQRIKDIYQAASRLGETARRTFLAQACRDDPGLLREVERLLHSPTVSTGELVPPPSTPPPSIGPYRVEGELGRGGMGVVYAARDAGGAPVAVKIVHPHLVADGRIAERLVREARLGRQVDHPAVVRTLDVGEEGGLPYLVLEKVSGRTLRELGRELGTVPERLLREIAVQVADGLAAIHGAGIVHRDLKPENILLTDDQRIRIMDLGIAKPATATVALTTEGHFLGSLHYAAPEQCEVGEVGPAADLYSLGVVLYELATGDNPFRRATLGAVIKAHLAFVPPAAADLNPEISAFFSELIATLLVKEPGERLPSSAVLAEALREGESGSWWKARSAAERSPSIPVRRDAPLHGRADELRILAEALAEAQEGKGGAILLEGEDGIGKTRLLDAFLRPLKGAHVLYGAFPPAGGMAGLAGAALEHLGGGRLEEALQRLLDRPPVLLASFAGFLRGEAPQRKLEGDALPSLFADLLRALGRERPLVWVVDDLHFAPPHGATTAAALARAAEGQRALVLLAARPGLVTPGLEGVRRLRLGRLSPREVVELLRDMLRSEELAERLGGKIAYKSDGVPFFIMEMVRGLEEGLFLRRRADGTYEQTRNIVDIEVPSAVRELVATRLAGVGKEERALLDLGAVQGYEFDADLVADVLRRPLVAVLQDLAEVERRRGIVRAAGRLYRFDHHQIQEVLYDSIPERLREEYHGLLAEAFAARNPGPATGREALFLASHFLKSSRPEETRPHLRAALEHLDLRSQPERALDLADRALAREGLLAGRTRLETVLKQSGFLHILGLRERQLAAAREAMDLAESDGDAEMRCRALRAMGNYHWSVVQIEEALRDFRASLDLARQIGDRREELRASLNLGMTLQRTDRIEEAQDQFLRCLAVAVEVEDPMLEGTAAQGLALTCMTRGEFDRALSAAARCRDLAVQVGSRRLEAYAESCLGLIRHYTGHWQAAREHQERSMALAAESGDRRAELVAIGNLGFLAQAAGRYGEALRRHTSHLAMAREVRDRRLEGNSLQNLAELYLSLGHLEGARTMIDETAQVARELGDRRLEGHVALRRSQVAVIDGDPGAARMLAEEAIACFRERDVEALPEALVALGRQTGEREPLEEARRRAREIDAPGWGLVATAHLARRRACDLDEAREGLALEARCTLAQRMEVRLLLWEAAGGEPDIAEAHRLLQEAREASPEEWRDAMVERVPLHRAVSRAWAESRP